MQEVQRLYNEAMQELDAKQKSYDKIEIIKVDLEKEVSSLIS